jgi:large subunit ribosomal protein L29
MVKAKELRIKPEEELNQLLSESQKKLRELRFNLASGKVKNVRTIRVLKKDIARILTILNEKSEKQF